MITAPVTSARVPTLREAVQCLRAFMEQGLNLRSAFIKQPCFNFYRTITDMNVIYLHEIYDTIMFE